ncbi:GDSL-type esterase/lipase family protein [Streptomyces enissocaesilis]|uniref:SGNH hydrolase-type esterase domain-containing protein n=1 Tax=Streptomyces enissocaesilis TaxID=332589 RepID=A0ABP6JUZ8_9ACTN
MLSECHEPRPCRCPAWSPNAADRSSAPRPRRIRQAHAKGIKLIGATLTPVEGSAHSSEANEKKRDAVNRWIRTSGEYDAVVALADPADRDRMLPANDSGDHLHPSDAGYRVMAEALDLDAL